MIPTNIYRIGIHTYLSNERNDFIFSHIPHSGNLVHDTHLTNGASIYLMIPYIISPATNYLIIKLRFTSD